MAVPVGCTDIGYLDGIPAVDHAPAADIDSDMACALCCISSLKEDQVSGLRLPASDSGAFRQKAIRRCPADMSVSGMIDAPAYEA